VDRKLHPIAPHRRHSGIAYFSFARSSRPFISKFQERAEEIARPGCLLGSEAIACPWVCPMPVHDADDARQAGGGARMEGLSQGCRSSRNLGDDIGNGLRRRFDARGFDALNAFDGIHFGRFAYCHR